MPQVVNGCGTWYWGKRNITTRDDFCPHCNHFTTLKSYDTTKCIVFVYLPVVPLRRLHVVDECPICRRHRAAPLKTWERGRAELINDVLADWRRNKADLDATKAVLGTAIAFQHKEAFDEVTAEMGVLGADDPLFLEAMGGAFEHFGELERAEQSYRASLDLAASRTARNALILNLLRQSKPDDAWPLLEDVLAARDEACVGMLQAAAEGYQALGRHDNALYVVEETTKAFPHLQRKRAWKRLRKQSEKHYHSGKSLRPTLIKAMTAPAVVRERRWTSRLGAAVIPLILLLVFAGYLASAYLAAGAREIYVVNGLPVAYKVEVAGILVSLPPLGRRALTVAEGDIPVRVLTDGLGIPEQTAHYESPFWSRPFAEHTVIINPDRAAAIYWEETSYAANPDPNYVNPYELHIGKLVTAFDGVDYVFEDFPGSISTTQSSGEIVKQRVALLDRISSTDRFLLIHDRVGKDAALDYLTHLPLSTPPDERILSVASALLTPQRLLPACRGLLDDRPVRVEAHRFYQSMTESDDPEFDLAGQYRPWLAAEPDNPDLMYLFARVAPEHAEAQNLLARAAEHDPPSARAVGALAFNAIATGEFEEALAHARRALALVPTTPSFQLMESHALMGLGRYGDLLAQQERIEAESSTGAHSQWRVCALAMLGRRDEAWAIVEQMAKENGDGDVANPDLVARERADLHYYLGETDQAIEALAGVQSPALRFIAAGMAHDLPQAAEALEAMSGDQGIWYLLLYAEAMTRGDQALSGDFLERAIGGLRTESAERRLLAAWLDGQRLDDLADALALSMVPQEKAIALVGLGVRFPEHRAKLFELARRVNLDHSFPYRSIADILARADSGGKAAGE